MTNPILADWKQEKLKNLLEKIIDNRGKSVPKADSGIPLITARNIREGYLDFSNQEFIDELKYEDWMVRGIPEPTDILFTTEAPLGMACKFPAKGQYAIGQRTIALRAKDKEITSDFLLYFFLSPYGQSVIDFRSTGSTAKGIKVKELKELDIVFPIDKDEQHRIVAVLEAWDKALGKLIRKIELKKNIKKGLMQQLLTGKRRLKGFSGEWKTVKLGDVCEICSSKRVLKKDWKSEGVPFYRTREIINLSNNDEFKSPIYISDELYIKLKEKYGIPKAGDILVTGVGSIGKTYITKNTDKFYFKDGNVLWIKVSNNINSNYLNQLFKTRFIKKQLFDNASITTVATFTIEGARKTYIKNPCFQEQTAIAKILATADDEITALGKKKQILENQKKYLLNNLITGQIRTPENLTISK